MTARTEQISGSNVFRLVATSGLITGLSANDVMFAFRNPSTEKALRLLYARLKWRTIAGFTAAQEVAIAAHVVTSFDTGNYTGGTDLSNPASNPAYLNAGLNVDSAYSYSSWRTKSVLVSGNVRIATTGALSASGTPVIQSQPFLWDAYAELAAAATVPKGGAVIEYAPVRDADAVLSFGSNAGFVVRPPVALGAGGTGRLSVELLWSER